jgi:amino acid transporter
LLRSGASSAIGLGTAALAFIAAAGYFTTDKQALIFMLATLWILGVTVIAFLSLLMSASADGGSAVAGPRQIRK